MIGDVFVLQIQNIPVVIQQKQQLSGYTVIPVQHETRTSRHVRHASESKPPIEYIFSHAADIEPHNKTLLRDIETAQDLYRELCRTEENFRQTFPDQVSDNYSSFHYYTPANKVWVVYRNRPVYLSVCRYVCPSVHILSGP